DENRLDRAAARGHALLGLWLEPNGEATLRYVNDLRRCKSLPGKLQHEGLRLPPGRFAALFGGCSLPSSCRPMAVQLLSGCHPVAVQLLSGGSNRSIRSTLGGHGRDGHAAPPLRLALRALASVGMTIGRSPQLPSDGRPIGV